MKQYKVFKVTFNIKKTVKDDKPLSYITWDILHPKNYVYVLGKSIESALAFAVQNYLELIKQVHVEDGYAICGIHGIEEYISGVNTGTNGVEVFGITYNLL